MAGLNVVALSEDTITAPGNRNANYVTVSVTKGDGTPVLGLAKPNFKVDPMIVGPGGALVDITRVAAGRLPGRWSAPSPLLHPRQLPPPFTLIELR